MEIVDVGPFKIIKALPADTKLMISWGALWTFGGRIQVENRWVDQVPIIDEGKLSLTRIDPIKALSKPGVEVPLVIEVRSMDAVARTSQKRFDTDTIKVIAKIDGTAWVVQNEDFYWAMRRDNSRPYTLSGPTFRLQDLIGEDVFKKLIVTLRSKVRKI